MNSDLRSEFLNWEWLRNQRSVRDGKYSRHLRFDAPLTVKMNGRANRGVILKPGGGEGDAGPRNRPAEMGK